LGLSPALLGISAAVLAPAVLAPALLVGPFDKRHLGRLRKRPP
jgi:hypothetical protein